MYSQQSRSTPADLLIWGSWGPVQKNDTDEICMTSLSKTSHPRFMESCRGYSRTFQLSCYKNVKFNYFFLTNLSLNHFTVFLFLTGSLNSDFMNKPSQQVIEKQDFNSFTSQFTSLLHDCPVVVGCSIDHMVYGCQPSFEKRNRPVFRNKSMLPVFS